MAFQITDDLLDYTQPEAVTGKPSGLDLKEHKVTLPLIAALPRFAPEERQTGRPPDGDGGSIGRAGGGSDPPGRGRRWPRSTPAGGHSTWPSGPRRSCRRCRRPRRARRCATASRTPSSGGAERGAGSPASAILPGSTGVGVRPGRLPPRAAAALPAAGGREGVLYDGGHPDVRPGAPGSPGGVDHAWGRSVSKCRCCRCWGWRSPTSWPDRSSRGVAYWNSR